MVEVYTTDHCGKAVIGWGLGGKTRLDEVDHVFGGFDGACESEQIVWIASVEGEFLY